MRISVRSLLTFNGGYTDTAGFLALQGLFTGHVTGNFVTLGASLVQGTAGVVPKILALPVFCIVIFLIRGISVSAGSHVGVPRMRTHSQGRAEYSWVIEGRLLGCRIKGTLLGQPFEEFTILGYDSFSQSAVVESADNSMVMSRGSPALSSPSASAQFGELDEYTSGSLHRPFKVIERWLADNPRATEVWDLGAGKHPFQN